MFYTWLVLMIGTALTVHMAILGRKDRKVRREWKGRWTRRDCKENKDRIL